MEDRESTQRSSRVGRLFNSRRRRLCWLVLLAVLVGFVYTGWYHLFRVVPATSYASDEEHFKYGGITTAQGFPLYVLEAIPEVFEMPEPGDWSAFGFIVEEGKETPIGWAEQTVGFPGISFNCALCHTGSFRTDPSADRVIVPGAPAHELDFDRFQEFLFACAEDPRFNGKEILGAIEKKHDLSFTEKMVYRHAIIPGVRKWLLKEKKAMAWAKSRPPAGRGRTDAFNLLKIDILKLPDDGSVASSDFLPLWHQAEREGLALHWNGCGTDLREENLISAYSVCRGYKGFSAASFDRVTRYLAELPAPRFPFEIDRVLARRGRTLYESHCARCHDERRGQVTSVAEVGTDAAFLQMMTAGFVEKLKSIDHPPFKFSSVRRTDGYVNVPLDGCWMRAPYLHNGSVPSLADLLEPPGDRPSRFYRGGNLYDPERMGFVGESGQFEYDTTAPGNGNGGHLFGTDLPPADKRALLEYLKTL